MGRYQAVQHLLADVATALELATPLLYGAAVTGEPADVSAANVSWRRSRRDVHARAGRPPCQRPQAPRP
ncbi:hypothetical protein AB0383_06465 [Amycolatopsis sp. NPDC051373]|uniref:hypothetical protein n=1 Tax=Amycolatopsis sp. NPDC051373 TaxID=3155801 RepID=UPI00344DB2C8